MVTGRGLLPRTQDPVNLAAEPGSHCTLIVPFRNPLDHPVLADITVTGMSLSPILFITDQP